MIDYTFTEEHVALSLTVLGFNVFRYKKDPRRAGFFLSLFNGQIMHFATEARERMHEYSK